MCGLNLRCIKKFSAKDRFDFRLIPEIQNNFKTRENYEIKADPPEDMLDGMEENGEEQKKITNE